VRVSLALLSLVFVALVCAAVGAQSPNGSITGIVFDPDGKTIPGAQIIVVNDLTRVQYLSSTNNEGIYTVADLPPGPYRIQVTKSGFKGIIKPDIVVNVQDALSLNFTLPVGAESVTVTVEGGAPIINTTDAAVSTVVDRNFVENMPLNGRSFQDLILLTPGIVTNNPQSAASIGNNGEFSVNGQRTEENYYTVDGVSANIGTTAGNPAAPSNSGSLPASTALGTTQGLVSVDALQEFRIQSSTYSAEFGRTPGGQLSFVTRSGGNDWHGTLFEYLRNNVFDANDWFNDYYGQPEPPLRQNDFGGTLGGRVKIPGLYDGRDKTFFFVSYEGLRLVQPQAASISYVPTTALREAAPSALQTVLNAFPLPNCPASATNCSNDLGNGLGEFVGTWSNPSSIDSYSIRADHALSERWRLFFRISRTTSNAVARYGGELFQVPSVSVSNPYDTRTYTFGSTNSFSSRVSNDFRLNYSWNGSTESYTPDNFGGAKAVNLVALQGLQSSAYTDPEVAFGLLFPGYPELFYDGRSAGKQEQWNIVDAVSVEVGRHQFKLGVDYRRLTPQQNLSSPLVEYIYHGENSIEANNVDAGFANSYAAAYPLYANFSAYVEDEWRVAPRLNLSLGLRWDVNPAPGATKGSVPYTIEGNVNDPASLVLAPQGTPLWQTSWNNLAPRFGAAYVFRQDPRFETVLRGGFGVFYDTGQQLGSQGYLGAGFHSSSFFSGSFPAPVGNVTPPIVSPPVPPYGTTYVFPKHLVLPYTLQWNVSVEQALGKSQTISASYVGANGRRLLEDNEAYLNAINGNFTYVNIFQNGLTSDYNALQIKFHRRLSANLQVLASYTWSHAIDYGSQNEALPYVRGNSDYDVRHNVSAALSYDLPSHFRTLVARALLNHWGLDDRISARTAFPVTLYGTSEIDPTTGQYYNAGLNLVPGAPLYLYGSQYPGGRSINPNAFTLPAAGLVGDAPRNFVRGFGAAQMDLAVRREFPIHERLRLQFRAEAFNLFNRPNFGLINSTYGNVTFGQAIATLSQSLGVLSPLYQMGGPRSMQFALKVRM
jgi:hypothetical protein